MAKVEGNYAIQNGSHGSSKGYNSGAMEESALVNFRSTVASALHRELLSRLENKEKFKHQRNKTDEQSISHQRGSLHVILTGTKKDCKVCSSRNKPGGRYETTYYCDTCPDKPRMYHDSHTSPRKSVSNREQIARRRNTDRVSILRRRRNLIIAINVDQIVSTPMYTGKQAAYITNLTFLLWSRYFTRHPTPLHFERDEPSATLINKRAPEYVRGSREDLEASRSRPTYSVFRTFEKTHSNENPKEATSTVPGVERKIFLFGEEYSDLHDFGDDQGESVNYSEIVTNVDSTKAKAAIGLQVVSNQAEVMQHQGSSRDKDVIRRARIRAGTWSVSPGERLFDTTMARPSTCLQPASFRCHLPEKSELLRDESFLCENSFHASDQRDLSHLSSRRIWTQGVQTDSSPSGIVHYPNRHRIFAIKPSRQMAEALHGEVYPALAAHCLTGMAWIFLGTVSKRARFVSRSFVQRAARTGRRDEIVVEVERGIFLHTTRETDEEIVDRSSGTASSIAVQRSERHRLTAMRTRPGCGDAAGCGRQNEQEEKSRWWSMEKAITNCLGDPLMPWPTAGRTVRKFTRKKEARERRAEESYKETEVLDVEALNNTRRAGRSVLFFNRVPKVGSQTFMELLRRLSMRNGFSFNRDRVQRVETIRLAPIEQLQLARMVSSYSEPSVYIKHVCFTNFTE
ncbi:Heparan sulfate 2-O-sulfotransferase pipe [Melipona quadrifasciata]|uniref:Heparan sulfate 2-O-sulfotransferase pipe n=1 Tax=Melipona quadrifasciata TaxID=166423 RepID=A0A0M9A576_9HYME|nr:Heparan sulfate 2-O-sulfotransferase pipe [Melipona quadrifasciata]